MFGNIGYVHGLTIMLPMKFIRPEKLWLLASITLILVPHFANQKPVITLFNLVFIAWRLLYEMQIVKLPSQITRIILAFASFIIVTYLHQTILGLFAGSALLTVMLCLKLLEMHTWRDSVVVISLAYFVTVTNFLYNQSLFMGLYLLIVVLVLTTTLIAFNQETKDKTDQFKILKLATHIVIQAIPLALLLFFLFPRIPGPLWNLPDDAHSGLTGLSDSMTPGQISQLSNNESVAFRAKFNTITPTSTQRYWRGPVLNHFDGKTWRSTSGPTPDYTSTAIMLNSKAVISAQATPVEYSVMLEPHDKTWLFALDIPTQIPSNTVLTTNYELRSSQAVKQLIRYNLTSFVEYKLEPNLLSQSKQYLQIPKQAAPKTRALVKTLVEQAANSKKPNAKLITLALDYIRNQPFFYTQNPPLLRNDPVDDFLFKTRKGFCEHYASAFAVIMRMAKIPSRVVTGYLGGEYNNVGDYWAIKQSDAHAWTEVWLPDQGWLRVDPTAVIPANRVEYSPLIERFSTTALATGNFKWLRQAWRKTRYGWDNINYYWNIWIIGYDDEQQTDLLSKLGFDNISWKGLSFFLFSSLSIVLMVITLIILKRKSKPYQDPVQVIYARYCKKLERIGIIKKPSETAIQLANRAIQIRPELDSRLNKITDQYNNLRYSQSLGADLYAQFKKTIAHLNLK